MDQPTIYTAALGLASFAFSGWRHSFALLQCKLFPSPLHLRGATDVDPIHTLGLTALYVLSKPQTGDHSLYQMY